MHILLYIISTEARNARDNLANICIGANIVSRNLWIHVLCLMR